MNEWGSKYNSETDAWEALKGICGRSDIQLQGQLEETEKEVMPEPEIKAEFPDETNKEEPEIADEKDSVKVPLMSETGHGISENRDARGAAVHEEQQAIHGPQSSEGTQAAHEMIPKTSTDRRFQSNKQSQEGQTASNLERPSLHSSR